MHFQINKLRSQAAVRTNSLVAPCAERADQSSAVLEFKRSPKEGESTTFTPSSSSQTSFKNPPLKTQTHEPQEGLELELSAQAMAILAKYRSTRAEFGMNRMHLGSYLHLIKEGQLWRGVAESWESFLASENLNPHAARQYMSVAKKFIFDMDLSPQALSKLAGAGITALERAGKTINESNQEEVLGVLETLSERDAIQRILEISGGDHGQSDKPSLKVLRVLREFYELPPDMQRDFLNKVSRGGKS